jgi:hypothetical protein
MFAKIQCDGILLIDKMDWEEEQLTDKLSEKSTGKFYTGLSFLNFCEPM